MSAQVHAIGSENHQIEVDGITLYQPGQYVMHNKSPRGENGILLGENLLMVIDPKWVGIPHFIGQTCCVYAIPGYDRSAIQAQIKHELIVPYMTPNLDAEKSVPFESLTPQEQQLIQSGMVIADAKRFVWNLICVHPKILVMRTDALFLVTDEMPISLNRPFENPAAAENPAPSEPPTVSAPLPLAEDTSTSTASATLKTESSTESVGVDAVPAGLSEGSPSVDVSSRNGENM